MRPFFLIFNGFISLSSLFAIQQEDCIYLPSVSSSNFYTQLSFLYWGASEKGLDFAVTSETSFSNTKLEIKEMNFEWSPAFRALLGFLLPHDDWKIDVSYSFFFNHAYQKLDETEPTILSVWTSPGAFSGNNLFARWQQAKAKWRIQANFFDLLLRNELYTGFALSFQPSFGIRCALLDQGFSTSYRIGNTVNGVSFFDSTINMKNRSFNLGPSFLLSTRWSVASDWKLISSLTGALLGSYFTLNRDEIDVFSVGKEIRNFKEFFWSCRPQAGALIGILWERWLNKIHFGISASYETQVWWKQNMLLRHIDAPISQAQNVVSIQGDLFFQGLTVDFFFDF